jgi:predicted phosphodiesterase
MNVLPISDTHFEWFKSLNDYNSVIDRKYADIVVLAGDIAGGTYAIHFIKHLISLGYKVIYVLGNHEFYNKDVLELIEEWTIISAETDDLYFLENDSVVIGDFEFFGSCLWTSVGTKSKSEEIDFFLKLNIKKESDFTAIQNWNPTRMKDRFYHSLPIIKNLIEKSTAKYKIMVSHFLPSYICVNEAYINSTNNPMFATELGDYIANSTLNYWFHGHTHCSVRENINGTHLICNPYGYNDLNMINPNFSWTKHVFNLTK